MVVELLSGSFAKQALGDNLASGLASASTCRCGNGAASASTRRFPRVAATNASFEHLAIRQGVNGKVSL